MPWLRKTAQRIEVIENHPELTASGTCALCTTMDGNPVNEVGRPPFHNHCACRTRWIQETIQPEEVLEEEFLGLQPQQTFEEPEPGGVEMLTEEI